MRLILKEPMKRPHPGVNFVSEPGSEFSNFGELFVVALWCLGVQTRKYGTVLLCRHVFDMRVCVCVDVCLFFYFLLFVFYFFLCC